MSGSGDEPLQSGTATGGALSALNPLKYVDGTQIQWRKLLRTIFGAGVAATLGGAVSVVLGVFDIPLALLASIADLAGAVVGVLASLPAYLVDGSFQEAAQFVADSGPAGFIVAVGITLATLYVLAQVVSRVR